ncbi:hypothetical protein RSAG8_11745, partial [Rhizoctonia solani AG-8 WAC10335]
MASGLRVHACGRFALATTVILPAILWRTFKMQWFASPTRARPGCRAQESNAASALAASASWWN